MHITIKITYTTRGIRVERKGTFPLRGRRPEKAAADWFQELKKEMDVDEILSVIVDGNEDISEKVIEIQKAPLD